MGKPVYVGRAVDHGELKFDQGQGAWVQEVKQPVDAAAHPWFKSRLLKGKMRRQTWAVAAAVVVAVATLAALASNEGVRRLFARHADLPVATYTKPIPGSIEDVGEPYRPTGALPAPVVPTRSESTPAPLPIELVVAAQQTEPTPHIQAAVPVFPAAAIAPQVAAKNAGLPVGKPAAVEQKTVAKEDKAEPAVLVNRVVEKSSQPAQQLTPPAPKAVAPALQKGADLKLASPLPARRPVRLVTIMDANTIVVSDPATGIPKPVKVGAVLHDGATLVSVDVKAGTAQTDRGVLRLE